MSDVFISYSRKDEPFVRRLHEEMIERGRDVWVDWEDIPLTADWWQEIQAGIDAADTFVFVISPDSAQSQVCYNEVAHAHNNHKRLVPVVWRNLSPEDQQKLHPSINRHNWVFFTDESRFEQNIERLINALDTDLSYVRDHTRLLVRAKEWDRNRRNNSFLLRGDDLANAENLLVQSGQYTDPKPTDLQTEYIFASRRFANRRQRLTLGAVLFGLLIAVVLAVAAFINFRQAESNLLLSRRTQSLFLADLSRQELEAEHYRVARLLALEAVEYFPTIANGESNRALLNALTAPAQKLISLRHDVGPINTVRVSQSENQILSAAGNQVLIWDVNSGEVVLRLQHDDIARGGLWNTDESRILTWSDDGTARVWDPFIENELFRLVHEDTVNGAFWIMQGTRILTWSDDGTVRLWDSMNGAEVARFDHNDSVRGVAWHTETQRLLAWAGNEIRVWMLAGAEIPQPTTLAHDDRVNGAAWNASGDQILSWSRDGSARIWDASSGEAQQIFLHDGQVNGAVWNASEDRILTWGRSPTAQVWTVADQLSCPLAHDGNVNGATWDTAGQRVLTWAGDGKVRVWAAPCSDGAQEVGSYERSADGAMWNSDETQILSWSADNTAQVWDVDSQSALFDFEHGGPVIDAAWGDDERRVISTSLDNTIQLWTTVVNNPSREEVVINLAHDQRVTGATWNNDESQVLSWSADSSARMWDARVDAPDEDRLLAVLGHGRIVNNAAWNADQSLILTASQDGVVGIWQADGSQIAQIEFADEATGAVWDNQGQRILAWSRDGTAGVWNPDSTPVGIMEHDVAVTGAQWNPDQTQVLTWTPDGRLRLWTAAGELVGGPWRHSGAVLGAAWNAAGDRILSWSEDGTVRVWTLDNPMLPVLSLPHGAAVTGAKWSPGEDQILTWTRDNRDNNVTIWNAQRGEQLAQLPHGSSSFGVQGADWSQDGTRILSWSSNGVVRVWNVDRETGLRSGDELTNVEPQPLVTLRHDRFVNGATWNADETRVLSWSTDDTARIWNMDGEELFVFSQDDAVNGAMWNDDESKVLTWNSAGLVKQWVVDVPTMIEIGRQRVVEPLTVAERRMFFLSVPTVTPGL